jgi:methionine biosynthesis protein MetW
LEDKLNKSSGALYEDIWQRKTGEQVVYRGGREEEAFKELIGGDGTLLDIGCGQGHLLDLAKDRFKSTMGVDGSWNALKNAAGRGLTVVRSDFGQSSLPFADECAEAVTCLDVIEHVFDPYHLLKEIWRILRPGGTLVITTPNTRFIAHVANLLVRGVAPRTNLDLEGYDGGHLHYFCFRDLNALLTECGFLTQAMRGIGFEPFHSVKLRVFRRIAVLWEKNVTREFFHRGMLIKAVKAE